jgi:flagellar M-ring protein FliF
MKETFERLWERVRTTLSGFTTGQKAIAGIGIAALLLAGFLVVRWVSTPSYAPLYTNLASSDASAVIDQLNTQGIPYKLTSGGTTIMVPQQDVYSTRISLSGKGLPSSSDSGYSLLDKTGLSTSDFQEQTDFKRAMEAELDKTIASIDGIQAAIVHLAMPEKQVFADKQDPTTASVLLQLQAGTTLTAGQVQGVVHLVSSSIDGLDPDNVTVTDSAGNVLSAAGDDSTAGAAGEADQVTAFQNQMSTKVQSMLDRVLGPGNSNVQVTADLDFDKAVTESTRYFANPDVGALSAASSTEKYNGTGTPNSASGVVGPDGQMESDTGSSSGTGNYSKVQKSSDNAVDKTVEHREAAPGAVKSLHVGVAIDTLAAGQIAPAQLRQLISSSLGIDTKRGDTVDVSTLPFNRTAEKQAAAELKQQAQQSSIAKRNRMIRDGVLGVLACLVLLFLWMRGRKKARARAEATSYVVEQLRLDAAERAAATQVLDNPNPALAALESSEDELNRETREEIAALVERQPEDVAALLRGWLVDRV